MNRSASRLSLCGAIFDASKKRLELSKTEELISSPDFWNDSERSQKLMQERKRLEKGIADDAEVSGMTEDLDTFLELMRKARRWRRRSLAGWRS
jgi:peptide chain release factor 2